MAEITFLAPGSCQLEVTAQGDAGTDTGVDLASVSWTIEQALIAGCRFSPSAGDVHIDRNGVLTIGRSLFDRINQADGDENIPGQCTLVIRADSTITKTVLDRFKVLIGYPGEGGGSGGGGVDVGNLQNYFYSFESMPSVGDNFDPSDRDSLLVLDAVFIDDSVIAAMMGPTRVASGTWAFFEGITAEERPSVFEFVVEINADVATIGSVETMELEWKSAEVNGHTGQAFKAPVLEEGVFLGFVFS